MRGEAEQVVEMIAGVLAEDGYLRSDGLMAPGDVLPFFAKMRSDAKEGRKKATPANGHTAALSFLKATVEDENRPMSERMDAARLLLMHSVEEK